MIIALLLATTLSFADSTAAHYATRNVNALEEMLERAPDREARLLCLYRLFPLTDNETLLDNLPEELANPTARELSLLAGLWGYRAAKAPLLLTIRYGGRSDRLLDRARRLDPQEPFLLLVDGQSLLFRPGFAGGDRRAALRAFERLKHVLPAYADAGISALEAEVWIWYALEKMGVDEAPALRKQLLARNPPALYRDFLQDPL